MITDWVDHVLANAETMRVLVYIALALWAVLSLVMWGWGGEDFWVSVFTGAFATTFTLFVTFVLGAVMYVVLWAFHL